jgi:hypothetical protein
MSTSTWPRCFTIEQSTAYPVDPSGSVTLRVAGSGRLDIKLRVPYWVRKGFTVRVNGIRQSLNAVAGGYVTLSRMWTPGDTISMSMPFSLRVERTLDQPQTQCITYGPIPLVAQSPSTSYLEFGFYQDFTLSGDLTHAITPAGAPMTFRTNGYTLAPFYNEDANPYHVYYHRNEPEIVFGVAGSGVPNRQGGDGLTFLDLVWAKAPFRDDGAFQRAVAGAGAPVPALARARGRGRGRIRSYPDNPGIPVVWCRASTRIRAEIRCCAELWCADPAPILPSSTDVPRYLARTGPVRRVGRHHDPRRPHTGHSGRLTALPEDCGSKDPGTRTL